MVKNVIYAGIGFVLGVTFSPMFAQAGVMQSGWPDAVSCVWDGFEHEMILSVQLPDGVVKYASTDPDYSVWVDFESDGVVSTALFDGVYLCDVEPGTTTISSFVQHDFGGASSTQMTINNPTQDMFNGVMIFAFVALFFIWFFRRNYDTQ